MSQQPEASFEDQSLLAEVRAAAAEHDPVPADVVAAAKASFTWRSIDAELAELIEDSALVGAGDAGRAAGVVA